MAQYKKILVIADPDQEDQPALKRALDLAKKSDEPIAITVFLAIYDFSYELTSMLSSDERHAMRRGVSMQREKWLNDIISKHYSHSQPIDLIVIWHNRAYEAIIQQILRQQHDLVIKATRDHALIGSVIFTPTDWHLLRKCPCPVLLVKSNEVKGDRILACVNLSSDDEEHNNLNHKIVEEAQAINHLFAFDGKVNLVNAYPSTPANITIELPEFDSSSYSDAVRGHHLTAMKALRQQHGMPEEMTHVLEGQPEDIIPQLSNDLRAKLVVLGTTGRTGLSAIFIGNTAEHIIDRLNCDLLALKPEGYVCPFSLDESS